MTKKDYIRFASMFRTMRPSTDMELLYNLWRELLRQMVDILASENSKFDRRRFYKAAGVEE